MSNNPYQSPISGTDQNYSTPLSQWRYIPLGILTLLATIGLITFSTLLVVSTFVFPAFLQMAAEDGPSIDGGTALVVLSVALVLVGCYLFNIVLICMFMYRANANVRAMGAEGVENTPGWCGGYWFIPIVNLFMPYKCMSEIHRASQDPSGRNWKTKEPHSLMGVWWGLWVTGLILDRVMKRSEAFNIEQYDVVMQWVGAALFVGAAIALIVILRSITELQDERAKKIFGK